MTPAAFRARLRRYPALGFLAVAALLASLLPSALRVPLSGPSTSAELAPVPGKSDVAQGDLSALGETSTGGLGAGSGLGGLGGGGGNRGRADATEADPGDGTPDPGSGRNPRNKRCVGKPPRQTEDPLSPPCVAFFDGDNGGATAKGVTRDEIRVVVTKTCGNGGYSPDGSSGRLIDFDTHPDDPEAAKELAAYVKYFNDRFQTFGRRVHLWAACTDGNVERQRAVVEKLNAEVDPFAVIDGAASWNEAAAVASAQHGIVTSLNGPRRALMAEYAPFLISYEPDLEDWAASTVEFVCHRLAGLSARFAGDPTLHRTRRKFGIIYDRASDPSRYGQSLILEGIGRECPERAGEIEVGLDEAERGSDTGATTTITRFQARGVTTVVFATFSLSPLLAAENSGYHPEWLVPDTYYLENYSGRNVAKPPAQWAGAFGITTIRYIGPPEVQAPTMAVREGCGGCSLRGIGSWYNEFLLLYTGIQAAGPRLTPANFDKGLHAITPRPSPDPFTPAAYFAPGNYSFIKDWRAVRWDPTGRPSGTRNVGCYRMAEAGKRYRAQDWRTSPGDEPVAAEGQPCQGEL